jgi:drug/metabolite transporter (DMT)-like permease
MKWLLVFLIAASTVVGDLLNAYAMRRHAASKLPLIALARNRHFLGGILCMAVGFFALLRLLAIADLSFAVPATSASYLVETILAKVILQEDVRRERWFGASLIAAGVGLLAV